MTMQTDSVKTKIEKILLKSYQIKACGEMVLFYMPESFCFINSVSTLIYKYLYSGKCVIITFPSVESIVNQGIRNARKVLQIIEELEEAGGLCFCAQQENLYCNTYNISFICSEYSGNVSDRLRRSSHFVVSLQTTSIYVHAYFHLGKFQEIFSKQASEKIDYFVASDYIAEWVCSRESSWKGKILRFGYPYLDALYKTWKEGERRQACPEEWKERISGKKVYLLTTWINQMSSLWLGMFAKKDSNRVAIWRPHPIILESPEKLEKIKKIAEAYSIILDDSISYNVAFRVSDALISPVNCGAVVNYLWTGKPVCIYDNEDIHKLAVIDYREETWYKSANIAASESDIVRFIENVDSEIGIQDESYMYRKCIVKHFDGKVCDRIYDFFDM